MSDSRAVGELLVHRKVLSRDVLEQLLAREQETQVPMVQLAASAGVAERDLVAAVATHLGMESWNPLDHPIPPRYRGMVTASLARKLRAVVVDGASTELVVAMEDPSDAGALDQLAQATGWGIRPAMASTADIADALEAVYGVDTDEDGLGDPAQPVAVTSTMTLNEMLARMVELGASDLHLSAGRPPSIRVHGDIRVLDECPVLTGSALRELVYTVLTNRQRERFEEALELDTSHVVADVGRFRMNVLQQKDSIGAVLRAIPFKVRALEDLGVPAIVSSLASFPRGLVLVTGPTGSGKSTTLASIVDVINSTRAVHIMTVEDPIEFLHSHKKAVVNQREVGEDTHSFANALKHVLRQDPDVILVGEMRDLETMSMALTAAETGHLVFGTLHTQDAPQSIDRVIDVFPAHQQQQIRVQLASALRAVVTQQLVPTVDGTGRVVVCEVLLVTPAVQNLIREGKTHQIYSVMQAGGREGMQTMDAGLARQVRQGTITLDAALDRCVTKSDLRRLVASAD